MTISISCGGTMLCISQQELPAAPLTDETLLPLVRRALAQGGQAMPLYPELKVFPSREGVLIFVHPHLPLTEPEGKPTYTLC